jgi:uncharacterized membrane protein
MDDGDLAMQMMRATGRKVITVVSLVAILSGCANMTDQEKYAIMGGIAGAATGIMIGTLGGNTALGAGVGTGAGMLGGYIYSLHH